MPDAPNRQPVIVQKIDSTYELFHHFYGSMLERRPKDNPLLAPAEQFQLAENDRCPAAQNAETSHIQHDLERFRGHDRIEPDTEQRDNRGQSHGPTSDPDVPSQFADSHDEAGDVPRMRSEQEEQQRH